MCSGGGSPKPKKEERPNVLVTARDGMGTTGTAADGSQKFRIDLNSNQRPYGGGLVIPR